MPLHRSTRLALALRSPAIAILCWVALASTGCVEASTEHRVRANAFLRGGDAESALRECDLGLEQKKDDPALLILRGKALFEVGRLDEARTAYERAVEASKGEEGTTLAEAHLGLAVIASRQKDWASARKRFEALVAINEKDATSHLNVARACLELKDVACAVEHGEIAGKLRGDDEGVLYTLGTIYLAAGQAKEAELTFQHICDVVPAAASCPYGLALVAARAGDKERALSELDKAVTLKVPNPERIAVDPAFAPLQGDPRFTALAARAAGK